MAAVTESVDVDVPLHTAYLQWTRFEDFPQFMDGVEEVVRLDAHHHYWRTFTGDMTREFGTETVEELPDERLSWRTVSDEPRQHALVTFRAVDAAHTTVNVVTEVEPEGLCETDAAPPFTQGRVKGDLLRFKEFVETHGRHDDIERSRIAPD